MTYNFVSQHPVTDTAASAATGKSLAQWFAEFDAHKGQALGRAALGKHLQGLGVDPWWCVTLAVEYEKHRGLRKKDGLYEGYTICSTKAIGAPVTQVFDAWTRAITLSDWFGPDMTTDAAEGGGYANADGDRGRFLRIRPHRDLRLSFEHPALTAPTVVDVQLEDKGTGKTGLVVAHSRIQTRAGADGLRTAWGAALDRLKRLCERAA